MVSWGKDGLNPKTELKVLPKTIETLLNTHGATTPVMQLAQVEDIKTDNIFDIIRVGNQRVTQKETPKRNKKDTDRPKKSKDMYCNACGTHGHGW